MPDPATAPTLDDVLAALAEGPLPVADLCDRLGLDPDDEGPGSVWSLLSAPRLVGLGDGRFADGVALARGRSPCTASTPRRPPSAGVRLDDDVVGPVAMAADADAR